ncbi:histidine phosphatase family protein [Pontibacter chitinilyticus]|uniref:histidine phosphatase family protein n=1 Tax=Pontibacter chitinilyticus TaxID=2674989 RepID=UPI00321B6679
MKIRLLLQLWLLLLIFGFSACRSASSDNKGAMAVADPLSAEERNAQPTTIFLVRHAEKDISDPTNDDPGLTPAGEARAEALRAELEGQQLAALYATKYTRTRQTLQPLAAAHQLEITTYVAYDFSGLKTRVLQDHKGKTVVVAGHSNTLLPILKAFGAKTDVAFISEQQYDYLFKVTVAPDGTATVETEHYGAAAQ